MEHKVPPHLNFLALPREIRNQIYHDVWLSKATFYVRCGNDRFEIIYIPQNPVSQIPTRITSPFYLTTKQPKRSESVPPWILACKQILYEAIEQFNHKCVWTADHRYWPTIPPCGPHFLLSPYMARTLRFDTLRLRKQDAMDMHEDGNLPVIRLTVPMDKVRRLEYFQNMQPWMAHLRRLELGFGLPINPQAEDTTTRMEVDLKMLSGLYMPHLTSLALTVRFVKAPNDRVVMREAFRKAFRALSAALVGKGKGIFTDRSTPIKFSPWEDVLYNYEFTSI